MSQPAAKTPHSWKIENDANWCWREIEWQRLLQKQGSNDVLADQEASPFIDTPQSFQIVPGKQDTGVLALEDELLQEIHTPGLTKGQARVYTLIAGCCSMLAAIVMLP